MVGEEWSHRYRARLRAPVHRYRSVMGGPSVSLVVVVYDMARELPRTLRSLAPAMQVGVDVDDYEVVVIDNGSPTAVHQSLPEGFAGRLRVARIDMASPSPASAANVGIRMA